MNHLKKITINRIYLIMLLKFIEMKWTFLAYLYIRYSILPVLPFIYNVNDFYILSIVLLHKLSFRKSLTKMREKNDH